MMKKRWISAYALSFAIVLFYPLFTPPAVTLAQIESSFDLEQADELYELFFNLPHLHFQTNKVFSIQNLTADPDELYDYINLEVSSTPQFHSYILRKILEIQDKTVATTRFLEKDTEVLVKIVETDFHTGDAGSFAYSSIAYFQVEGLYYAAATSIWGRREARAFSASEIAALEEQAVAEVRKIVRQIQKGNSTN